MANPLARLDPVSKAPWVFTLASVIVVVSALYFAKPLLVPIALAILLSFALSPICRWLERYRLGRIPAVLVTAFMGFALIGAVFGIAAAELASIAPKIPKYQKNVVAKFRSVNIYAERLLSSMNLAAKEMSEGPLQAESSEQPQGTNSYPFAVRIVSSPLSPMQVFGGVYSTLAEFLGSTAIVIVLVIFFLVRREDLRDRFIYLVGKKRVTLTTQTMQDAGQRVSNYLSTLFLINLAFGISVGIGLRLIGLPNAMLWGILAMTLRFIPYIGPWIAAAMPIGISLAISDGWLLPLYTVLLFVVLELFNNNLLEPWLYGKNTGISAVAVLVAAFFWMWLWGPIGLLLATPLTVCVMVVGKHVPELSFLNILLGSEQVFELKDRIYQRLLAGDQDKAAELLDECAQETSLALAYGTVLIPALVKAETDWQLGELNDEKHTFILNSLREVIQDQSERRMELLAKASSDKSDSPVTDFPTADPAAPSVELQRQTVLCLPARSEADEITALLLAQILKEEVRVVEALPALTPPDEIIASVVRLKPDVICIAATPPAAIMHARHLARRIRERTSGVPILVGLWDARGDLVKAKERIGCDAIVVGSLADAIAEIRKLHLQLS